VFEAVQAQGAATLEKNELLTKRKPGQSGGTLMPKARARSSGSEPKASPTHQRQDDTAGGERARKRPATVPELG
jgi:hypothetical protein